ncbi:sigma-70 family RNA polymerase sigma factor [Leptolyngbya sp. AN02str]|uniref:sigma-70 family RNA polymerase sigma factor n=1 Tax=Leptolyngbya sp. AN02str TaxID=3423363 RepID=UPI003D316663
MMDIVGVAAMDEQLKALVEEACSHPPGSAKRQRSLTQIIRLATPKLWRESTPHYQDALQQTWIFFCQNICEAKTGQQYDPERGSVTTWLNAYLRRRLQDFFIDTQKQQATTVSSQTRISRSGEAGEVIDPIDNLPANPDVPPILEGVLRWATEDTSEELRQVFVEGHPQVNCQTLILRRLPPESSWKDLSAEFGLPISTLSSFYQRQCLPRLRKFGESEGYL